ncbi:MAG: class I SAM-dependent methyltransferase [Thermoplasmata archaeon]
MIRRIEAKNEEVTSNIDIEPAGEGTSSVSSDKNDTQSKFFDSSDWNRFWKAEVGGGLGIQKIVSKFRKHFDNEYVKQLTTLKPSVDGRILEVGCGTAHCAHKLGELGYSSFALDYSPQAKNFWDPKVANFIIADGFHLPIRSNSFDLVWNAGVLEHFSDPHPMLKEMIRVCKPGGMICVIVPYIFDILAHLRIYGEEKIFTKKTLRDLLRELDEVGIKVLYTCGGMLISGWGRKRT